MTRIGEVGWEAHITPPPTPCAPRPGVSASWEEGVELHGTVFAVLHGRSSDDPTALRKYAAAVLAAAEMIEKGTRDAELSERR